MAEFLTTPLGIFVLIFAQVLAIIAFVMISLLFLVWGDRKIWAAVQMRKGRMWWALMVCCNRWRMR